MKSIIKESQFKEHIKISPSFRKRRYWRISKAQLKKEQEMLNNDYSLDIAPSTYEDKSIDNGDKKDENGKRYKTRDEITFLEQQLIKDPSWSRKTVQLCKRTLGIRTDQIYKWGYDRKMAMKRYLKLYPESNGMKARFVKSSKDINKNDMNDVVDNIVESMKQYKIYNQCKEENSDYDSDSDINTQSLIFHYDETNEAQILQAKEIIQNEFNSDPIGLNEFSMKLNSIDWFNEELYLTLSRDNHFY